MRVATVVGTRPEVIRLSRVIAALDRSVEHVLIHTGQNYDYELNGILFEDLEIRKPDFFLDAAGKSPVATIANVMARSDELFGEVLPDAVLVLGDTNSCLAAIAAKRRKIPVFHMEAGNRCFDERVPEEINRRIVDHISDINMPYSDISRQYLLREGIAPDRIIKTGSPMYEVLTHYRPKIDRSGILSRLDLKEGNYIVVSAHREENIESPRQFRNLVEVLNLLASIYGLPVIVSVHPRTRKRIDSESIAFSEKIRLMSPISFSDYVHLMMSGRVTLSDSGTITEESSILNFRALNIREAQERPEGMEEGAVMMVGLEPKRILAGMKVVGTQPTGPERTLRIVKDYHASNVSEKVVRIILSYTDYVNTVVWKKSQ